MRKIVFILISFSLIMFSCKTSKNAKQANVSDETIDEVVVIDEEGPAVIKDDIYVEPVIKVKEKNKTKFMEEPPIVIVQEEVQVAKTEDQSKGNFAYYVIMGSFSKVENANRYMNELTSKGYSCVILNPESDKIRVAAFQTNSEAEAREQIKLIRQKGAQHKDVWLLKKK